MTAYCRLCEHDLAHCHGTVILHVAARPECTEPECETPEFVHSFTIDCAAVGCTCDVIAVERRAV